MAKDFFTEEERQSILNAIKEAELNTSGEVRVHIENSCKKDVLDRAAEVFDFLKMQKTELRNGVLIYLSLEDRKLAIIGDAGINKVVADDFWDSTYQKMKEKFKAGEICKGLVTGIKEAGQQLKAHFPYQSDDVNELPDEISFGKDS